MASGPVHAGDDFAANTHIISHAGRTLATVEAGALPYELTDELGTRGPRDFGGTLPGGFAAHTKLDPRTGELHAIAYYWAWDYVQHIVIGRDGEASRTTNIPVPDGPMMHDFALTENYVVLFESAPGSSQDARGQRRRERSHRGHRAARKPDATRPHRISTLRWQSSAWPGVRSPK